MVSKKMFAAQEKVQSSIKTPLTPITATVDFLREVKVELDKVVWPSRIQTIKLTVMVIIVTIVVGFFLGGLDYLLTQLAAWLLKGR